jgi:hypothetical protein
MKFRAVKVYGFAIAASIASCGGELVFALIWSICDFAIFRKIVDSESRVA